MKVFNLVIHDHIPAEAFRLPEPIDLQVYTRPAHQGVEAGCQGPQSGEGDSSPELEFGELRPCVARSSPARSYSYLEK